jgi:predicted nucleic-acid-binding protein
VRITADTNVLVRALVQDDPEQAKAAADLLERAELIAIPVPVLCELVWVLRRVYGFAASDCASSIEALIGSSGVAVDRQAVRAGLKLLSSRGDFADGVIAYGPWW